ncbi:glycosyl hydrolase family 39 [Pelomyxa schiedti]|nr:glycosyl hydrolase family 39 [Pelomyxa schiedti]
MQTRRQVIRRVLSSTVIALVVALEFVGCIRLSGDVSGDPLNEGHPCPNAWYSMNWFDYTTASWPDHDVTSEYPFLATAEIFTATGGCYIGFEDCGTNRDLFIDPSDPSLGYNFDQLVLALKGVRNAGLKPYVVTGNVPVQLSTDPEIGVFNVNTQPPANFSEYRNYIASLAESLVDNFGLDEVRSWQWGVLTEYNNADWYILDEESYFALYDWTVCALESVLGSGLYIGAHACTQCEGDRGWTSVDLLDHVLKGVNYCTGQIGSPLAFFTDSFYESSPGNPGDMSDLKSTAQYLRRQLSLRGLDDLPLGIDEGRILSGPDELPLLSRAVGATYQASLDALMFKIMMDYEVDYYSRWNVNTDGLLSSSPVNPIATNVALLTTKMIGSTLYSVSVVGLPSTRKDMVDGVIGLSNSTLSLFVFNHNPEMDGGGTESVDVSICGISDHKNENLVTVVWTLDDNNGQFWNVWWQDMLDNDIQSFLSGWSKYSDQILLTDPTEISYFDSRRSTYQSLSQMTPQTTTLPVDSDGCITTSLTMTPHSVQLLQVQL